MYLFFGENIFVTFKVTIWRAYKLKTYTKRIQHMAGAGFRGPLRGRKNVTVNREQIQSKELIEKLELLFLSIQPSQIYTKFRIPAM